MEINKAVYRLPFKPILLNPKEDFPSYVKAGFMMDPKICYFTEKQDKVRISFLLDPIEVNWEWIGKRSVGKIRRSEDVAFISFLFNYKTGFTYISTHYVERNAVGPVTLDLRRRTKGVVKRFKKSLFMLSTGVGPSINENIDLSKIKTLPLWKALEQRWIRVEGLSLDDSIKRHLIGRLSNNTHLDWIEALEKCSFNGKSIIEGLTLLTQAIRFGAKFPKAAVPQIMATNKLSPYLSAQLIKGEAKREDVAAMLNRRFRNIDKKLIWSVWIKEGPMVLPLMNFFQNRDRQIAIWKIFQKASPEVKGFLEPLIPLISEQRLRGSIIKREELKLVLKALPILFPDKINGGTNEATLLSYIAKATKEREDVLGSWESTTEFYDGINTALLLFRHGLTVEEIMERANFKPRADFEERHMALVTVFRKLDMEDFPLNQPYEDTVLEDDYYVVYPKTSHELIEFGVFFSNCVSTYAYRIKDKETNVFILYKKGEPIACCEQRNWNLIQASKKRRAPISGLDKEIVQKYISDGFEGALDLKEQGEEMEWNFFG